MSRSSGSEDGIASGIPALRPDLRGGEIELTTVRTLLERIVERWHPRQIWLFGSRARGDSQPSSDWDLLVVVPDEVVDSELDPLIGWRLQNEAGIHADVIPCRACDFIEDRETRNTLAFEVATAGVLLYERGIGPRKAAA